MCVVVLVVGFCIKQVLNVFWTIGGRSTVSEEMERHSRLMQDDIFRPFIIFALISANHRSNLSKLKKLPTWLWKS